MYFAASLERVCCSDKIDKYVEKTITIILKNAFSFNGLMSGTTKSQHSTFKLYEKLYVKKIK